jgi:hypothetical protein
MKSTFAFAILLSVCISCSPQPNDQLTQQQIDQIKKDIKLCVDSVMMAGGNDHKLQCYADSSGFHGFALDGSQTDIQAIKKSLQWFSDSVVVYKLNAMDHFPVVAKDFVVYAWSGSEELGLKAGDRIKYQPRVVSFVFRKLEGKWKIVYTQESGTKTTEKPVKK